MGNLNTKEPETYDEHVEEALNEVSQGQHLRFIRDIYQTKEICLTAVNYEFTHNHVYSIDIGIVPMGNIDYVMEHMRENCKDDTYFLQELEKTYNQRKLREQTLGYYGDFLTYQDLLDHWKAADYDDMSRKKYEKWFGLNKTGDIGEA
jgi:hypothetical protein